MASQASRIGNIQTFLDIGYENSDKHDQLHPFETCSVLLSLESSTCPANLVQPAVSIKSLLSSGLLLKMTSASIHARNPHSTLQYRSIPETIVFFEVFLSKFLLTLQQAQPRYLTVFELGGLIVVLCLGRG